MPRKKQQHTPQKDKPAPKKTERQNQLEALETISTFVSENHADVFLSIAGNSEKIAHAAGGSNYEGFVRAFLHMFRQYPNLFEPLRIAVMEHQFALDVARQQQIIMKQEQERQQKVGQIKQVTQKIVGMDGKPIKKD